MKFLESTAEADPLGDFLREKKALRRPRPRIRLPAAPVEQLKPLGAMTTRIRLATQDSLFIEQAPGEAMAKFFAAGAWWFIRPEFIAAFQRLSGHDSVPFRDLAVLIADKQLVGMLVGALDTLANAGVVFKEEAQPMLPSQ
jgi:hypothetical protein